MSKIKENKNTIKAAFYSSLPIIFGYLPTSFIFGFLLVSSGYHYATTFLMSWTIYAGAGQYLAVELFLMGSSYINTIIMTFLINSKHLFYGLSLIDEFNEMKKLKWYMIFTLTDETYAVLTNPKKPEGVNQKLYRFLVSIFNHSSWIMGSVLGGILGNIIDLNTEGMDFAMTALFLVIIVEQLKSYKTKIPFVVGGLSGLFICLFISKSQILILGAVLSIIFLLIFKNKIEQQNQKGEV